MRDRLIELIIKSDILCHTCGENSYSYCAEAIADYLLSNGVIVPPCKVGDEINGEVVCEIIYSETLGLEGNIHQNKRIYTCDKANVEKKIYVAHHMTWEKAEQALKGGVQG